MTKKRTVLLNIESDSLLAPATVERKGTDASGASYSIRITVGGLSINGLDLPSEMAANYIADSVEGAIQKAKPAKRKAQKGQ